MQKMNLINNKRGLSRIEVFCIVGIALIVLFAAYKGVVYYYGYMARGHDNLKVNSCESVAMMNLSTTGCVVNDCPSATGGTCVHIDKDGYTVGYYDAVERKIFAENRPGYNEYPEMKAGRKEYTGEKNTMVIMVKGKDSQFYLSWVEGDNK